MKEFSKLKKLSEEAARPDLGKLHKDLGKMVDKVENMINNIQALSRDLESDVLTGRFTAASFPKTEHNAAKAAARKAVKALDDLMGELEDLHHGTDPSDELRVAGRTAD